MSMFWKMNPESHSGQFCSSTSCSVLNELLHQYCVRSGRPNKANHLETVSDTINIQLFWQSIFSCNAVLYYIQLHFDYARLPDTYDKWNTIQWVDLLCSWTQTLSTSSILHSRRSCTSQNVVSNIGYINYKIMAKIRGLYWVNWRQYCSILWGWVQVILSCSFRHSIPMINVSSPTFTKIQNLASIVSN